MQVSKISFNGYTENIDRDIKSIRLRNELRNSRMFLREIGSSMDNGDIIVNTGFKNGEEILTADYFDKTTQKTTNLAMASENLVLGKGSWFVTDVMEGIKNHNKCLFTKVAKNFALYGFNRGFEMFLADNALSFSRQER